ncbi:MAG: phage protease [Verrucomicrobiota bacterium]
MSTNILNRDFEHPTDALYMIEPFGEHANEAAKVIQKIDDKAAQSIVPRFNSDAAAGKLSHGNEIVIDFDHFKHQMDKSTLAAGWLHSVFAGIDGIYGGIRWTSSGRAAVDGGDYRFFSTEYDPADLEILNSGSNSKVVRPVRLAGLTLTNMPNNRGGRPITNRSFSAREAAAGLKLSNRQWAETEFRKEVSRVMNTYRVSKNEASETAAFLRPHLAELAGLKNKVSVETADVFQIDEQYRRLTVLYHNTRRGKTTYADACAQVLLLEEGLRKAVGEK